MYSETTPAKAEAQAVQTALPLFDFERSDVLQAFVRAGGSRRRGRRQRAAVAFAALGDRLVDFETEIDEGTPLTGVIAMRCGVRPASVRRLRRTDPAEIADLPWQVDELLQMIDITSPDWLPGAGGWADFLTAHRRLRELAAATGRCHLDLLAGSGGRWADLARHLVWEDPRQIARPINMLYREVFLPDVILRIQSHGGAIDETVAVDLFDAPMPPDVRRALGSAWFGNKGPRAIFETIQDWRSGGAKRFPLSLPGGDWAKAMLMQVPGWVSLCAPMRTPFDLEIVPLTSPKELLDEGLAVGHCIGRYALSCCYKPYHAVSIRTECGFRLTTALLRLAENGSISIVDHRGAANILPDRRARQALEWFAAEVADERAFVDVTAIEHARRDRVYAAGGENAATRRTYPFYSPIAREWMFRAYYAPFLSPASRSMTCDAWLAETELAWRAEEMALDLQPLKRAA